MNILVGSIMLAVALENNPTAAAISEKLPLTVEMAELNGNEKYVYLPFSLPSAPEPVGIIKAGDVMLFGDDCLVIFYQNFKTSYTYTRIGRIEKAESLFEILKRGKVSVTFTK